MVARLEAQSIRPEWLFEVANFLQRCAYPSAGESDCDVLDISKAASELERAIERTLMERVRARGQADIPAVIAQEDTIRPEVQRAESRMVTAAAEEAQRVLRTEYAKSWTVEAVARRVGCNRTDLETAFHRRNLGSVHAYLIACRITRAKELLRSTAWRVEEIAKEVGYRSKTSLSEQFRRTVAISPEQYRDRWKSAGKRSTKSVLNPA